MGGIFKAYDVRGIYGRELDESMARAIGRAFPAILDEEDLAHGGSRVVVSRDMRPSSVPLSAALVDGLTAAGLDVVDIGLATTPMNYFAIGHLRAAGGVQVTASHNPAEYNGPRQVQDVVFRTPVRLTNGKFVLSDAPGLGLELDEAELGKRMIPWTSSASTGRA